MSNSDFRGKAPTEIAFSLPPDFTQFKLDFYTKKHEKLIQFMQECLSTKLAQVTPLSIDEKLEWGRKAVTNASTNMYVVAREILTYTHENEDSELFDGRIEDLAIGYSHIMSHVVDFINQLIHLQFIIAEEKKAKAEAALLEKLHEL